jgi:hypothetical protein
VVIDDYLADNGLAGAVVPGVATMRLPAWEMRTDNMYARDLAILDAGSSTWTARITGPEPTKGWPDAPRCGAVFVFGAMPVEGGR